MAVRYVGIFSGVTDVRTPPNRVGALAAGIGVDSAENYDLKFNKNGTWVTVQSADQTRALAATYLTDSTHSGGATLTNVDSTLWKWTVAAAATYYFKSKGTITYTSNGGFQLAFKLTTATLASINLRTYFSTGTDNTGAVSTAFTTTTDQALWVDDTASAFTNYVVEGTFVTTLGGSIAIQCAQHTSHADDTTIVIGSFAQMTRIL